MATNEDALQIANDDEQPNPAGPNGERIPVRVSLDPLQLLLGLLMNRSSGDWYKADRISRAELKDKYPTACRFSKTDGNIAAIDFGTTFCSLAFVTVDSTTVAADNLNSVEINTIPLNKVYPRVPTAILLKEKPGSHDAGCNEDDPVPKTCDFDVVEFGYDAVTKHCMLKPTELSKYLYFERFKMTLQQDEVCMKNKSASFYECSLMLCTDCAQKHDYQVIRWQGVLFGGSYSICAEVPQVPAGTSIAENSQPAQRC